MNVQKSIVSVGWLLVFVLVLIVFLSESTRGNPTDTRWLEGWSDEIEKMMKDVLYREGNSVSVKVGKRNFRIEGPKLGKASNEPSFSCDSGFFIVRALEDGLTENLYVPLIKLSSFSLVERGSNVHMELLFD